MITLRSDVFDVTLAPERGADIVQVLDRATEVPLFAVSPTGQVTAPRLSPSDSMVQWLNGYPGGWQLLAPNAGPERTHEGVNQGYHGEAALAEWIVLGRSDTTATLATTLLTAPLRLERHVALEGHELIVTDTVTNLSPDPTTARLVQHPAFGSPFLDEHSYIVVSAATVVADADAPGSLAAIDAVGRPSDVLAGGPVPNSIALPGPGSAESLFAALTDFPENATNATFMSPSHGFGIRLSWDRTVYPNAWLWIEANAGPGWPWFRRMYAVAVEPANVLPGDGATTDGRERGGIGVRLAGGESLVSTVRLARVPLSDT
ncbi:DUF4432 family protein [Rathayibacter soli]|uniref:DUF4432 family protein n=1 Tax=Rathayibacter soli TaxID=3144168 RepID=UPI0027E502E5|nr:DUF4432 family protein [Glaciibacter superstes]